MELPTAHKGGDSKDNARAFTQQLDSILSDELRSQIRRVCRGICEEDKYTDAVLDKKVSDYEGSFDDLAPSNLLKDGKQVTSDVVLQIVALYISGELKDTTFSCNGEEYEIIDPAYTSTLFSEKAERWFEELKDHGKTLPSHEATS